MINMSKWSKPSINNYIEEVRIRLGNVVENILEVGELYVEACKKYSTAKKQFHAAFPNVREATWNKFAAIGNHKLVPTAFFLDSSFATRLVNKKVPVKVQEKLITSTGVNVYRKETKKVECVPFTEFSVADEDTVFDAKSGKVRSVEEQKVFLEQKETRKLPAMWEGTEMGIKVNGKCFIPWGEVIAAFERNGKGGAK